jgi:hypothetical protein
MGHRYIQLGMRGRHRRRCGPFVSALIVRDSRDNFGSRLAAAVASDGRPAAPAGT